MNLRITARSIKDTPRGTLFVPMFSDSAAKKPAPLGILSSKVRVPEQVGECVAFGSSMQGVDSVFVVSLGARRKCKEDTVRQAGGAVGKLLGKHRTAHASVEMTAVLEACPDSGVQALCEGAELGAFRFDRYKENKKKARDCRLSLLMPRIRKSTPAQIRRATVVAAAANEARALAHEPPNVINPVTLASRARALAKSAGLRCKVLDDTQMARLKMGALLAVGKASHTPPRLIVMEYGRPSSQKPIVLIGKAITFDTGGYSLKDRHGMVGMKYDKCGGMAVLGIMKALANLKLKVPVVGIIAAAENMISGQAYRPNDIIRAMSGKTIEIISTDAEGRLVLADALTYAQKKYRPRAIIDLATLTGGVVVSLGRVRAGLFCNDDRLRDRLMAAGERTFERLWPLPLDDEYDKLIKGDDSDIKNSGGREAHPVIGAVFLKQFVDPKIPWAHIDIAGVATTAEDQPYCPKGATGFGVRLLADYLESL